ncbi:MAG: Rne/Rng family ribonuclease [Nitrospirae bacterium]|nr:Rne/Rng family ribonuclease [Nitrospirota bacterium]
MKKKILINAVHAEEKRVAIVEGDLLVDFYVEASGREHLRGNVYKATVVRIEPGLQAAFVDFGQKKQGFLQMREIKPEFFQKKVEGKRSRIQDVLTKGQELIVQVEKDERDTKGASLTTYISIPGRYIVMMPGQQRVGISRKIEDREDRERLKEIFSSLKLPKDMGFILRTACCEKTSEELSNDLKYLTKLWNKIQTESNKVSAPALIYKEQDIAVRTVRDYLSDDVTEVLIDDQAAYKNTKQFLSKTLPWLKINIKFYKDRKPIFLKHNIEEQISKLNERYVHLPSKGYLVIDKTEALTAIDVNSGRSRKEENVESTAFKTNIEAADEVARQFRLRDIGGLIVIDFIDMESSKNRRTVETTLRTALSLDKAHTEISGISKFGIVEMTRERMRTAYFESINRRCESCNGTGIVMTDEMVAITAFREIHTLAAKGGIKGITCKLPVESMNYLINMKRDEIALIEKEDKVSIRLTADTKMFPGQYTMTVDKIEEEKTAAKEEKTERKTERRGEHKAEYKTGRPAEHKPEQRAEQTPEHKEHTPEHKLESGKQPKRWPRSRGRRRPKYGPKTGPAAETAGTPAAESGQDDAGNEEASAKPFPVQHALTADKIQEGKAQAGEEKRVEHESEHDRLHLADHTSEPGAATERRPKRSRPWGKRRPKYGSKSGPSKETAGSDAEETPKTAAGSQNEGSSQD